MVGSGQSGCQIAEELQQSGRTVFLSCGRAPRAPRRIGDHDFVWWALETGFLDAPLSSLPDPRFRLAANVLTTGRDGGHDLHLRTLQRVGVTLLGHFLGAEGRSARFAPDLGSSVAWGDQRNAEFMDLVRKLVAERGLPRPDIPEPEPFNAEAPEQLSLDGFGAVVFAGGFRPDYRSWVRCPGAFDELGFPIHRDGASTAVRGLYFVGVHFLRKRKSSIFLGVGEDAAIVARQIAVTTPGRRLTTGQAGTSRRGRHALAFGREEALCMESATPPRDTAWAMSEENVEVVRRGYAAFNRGDLDAMVADFAPTFEYVASGAVPGPGGVYRGPEGLREFMGWFFGEFSNARAEINELTEAGDRVLVGTTARGRGSRAASSLAGTSGTSGPCGRARSCAGRDSPTETRPSKPPACRSRQCRRRTWTGCVRHRPPSNAVTRTPGALWFIPTSRSCP